MSSKRRVIGSNLETRGGSTIYSWPGGRESMLAAVTTLSAVSTLGTSPWLSPSATLSTPRSRPLGRTLASASTRGAQAPAAMQTRKHNGAPDVSDETGPDQGFDSDHSPDGRDHAVLVSTRHPYQDSGGEPNEAEQAENYDSAGQAQ